MRRGREAGYRRGRGEKRDGERKVLQKMRYRGIFCRTKERQTDGKNKRRCSYHSEKAGRCNN